MRENGKVVVRWLTSLNPALQRQASVETEFQSNSLQSGKCTEPGQKKPSKAQDPEKTTTLMTFQVTLESFVEFYLKVELELEVRWGGFSWPKSLN